MFSKNAKYAKDGKARIVEMMKILQQISEKLEADYQEDVWDFESGKITPEEFNAKQSQYEEQRYRLGLDLETLQNRDPQENVKYQKQKGEKTLKGFKDRQAILLDRANEQIGSNNNVIQATNTKISEVTKNNKALRWLGIITLGITSIVAAVRNKAKAETEQAVQRLGDATTILSSQKFENPDVKTYDVDTSVDDMEVLYEEDPDAENIEYVPVEDRGSSEEPNDDSKKEPEEN